jgi:hypothetical protein
MDQPTISDADEAAVPIEEPTPMSISADSVDEATAHQGTDHEQNGSAPPNKRAAEDLEGAAESKKMKHEEGSPEISVPVVAPKAVPETPAVPEVPPAKLEIEVMAQPVEGQMVEANWQNQNIWFPAKVAKVYEGDLYSLDFEDGEKEFRVPAGRIRKVGEKKPYISRSALAAMTNIKEGTRFIFDFKEVSMEGIITNDLEKKGKKKGRGGKKKQVDLTKCKWCKCRMWDGAVLTLAFDPISYSSSWTLPTEAEIKESGPFPSKSADGAFWDVTWPLLEKKGWFIETGNRESDKYVLTFYAPFPSNSLKHFPNPPHDYAGTSCNLVSSRPTPAPRGALVGGSLLRVALRLRTAQISSTRSHKSFGICVQIPASTAIR